jgi:hypothetical protein
MNSGDHSTSSVLSQNIDFPSADGGAITGWESLKRV